MTEQSNRPLLAGEEPADESVWDQARREAREFGHRRIGVYLGIALITIIVCASVAGASTERERPGVRSASLVVMGLVLVLLALSACWRVRSVQIRYEERFAPPPPPPELPVYSAATRSPAARLPPSASAQSPQQRQLWATRQAERHVQETANDIDLAVALSLSEGQQQQQPPIALATYAKPGRRSGSARPAAAAAGAAGADDQDADLVAALKASTLESSRV